MRDQAPEIYGTAKIVVSRLKSIFSEREAKNISRILIEEITGRPYTWWVVHPEARFEPQQHTFLQEALQRLLAGEPLHYILNKAWFMGEEFTVGPGVLVPRPETEELIEWVTEDFSPQHSPAPKILDIGTGSGCIAIMLQKLIPQAEVWALDFSEEALAIARKNAENLKAPVYFRQSDILQGLPPDLPSFDILVSNPPYITESEKADMDPQVVKHEPGSALFVPDQSPYLFYERMAALAPKLLQPGAKLYFEINEGLGTGTLQALQAYPHLSELSLRQDLSGKDRMIRCYFHPEGPVQ